MLKLLMLIFVVSVNSQQINWEQNSLLIINEVENLVTSAVLEIIDEFFAKETSDLSFTYSANDANSAHDMLETIEDILLKINSNFSISLEYEDNMNSSLLKTYNIIYVEDYESFLKIFNSSTPKMYDFQGFYLIILTNHDNNAINKILEFMWSYYIVNVNIITKEDADEPHMYTYYPYTQDYCEKAIPTILNIYNSSKLNTNHHENVGFSDEISHFPNKLANLHKCPLKVATVEIPPFIISNETRNGRTMIGGLDGHLLLELGKRMNFTIEATVVRKDIYLWGQLYENGTSTGAIEMVIKGKVNLTIGYYIVTPLRNLMMSASSSYYTSSLVWIIPAGRQLTSIEKLIKPFSPTLWSAVIIVFIISFLIISMIGCFTITIQNFVFGRSIRTPGLNVINVFFGGSLVQTPTRNFARTLLCFFLLYCLIIRSTYQGALFKYMQMDSRTPVMVDDQEMVHADYHFYTFQNSYEHISNLPSIRER